MKHCLSIRHLGKTIEEARRQFIDIILESMKMLRYYEMDEPPPLTPAMQDGKKRKFITVFSELSTRTKVSTEEAARSLGWIIANAITPQDSSLGKHESWMNTLRMLIQYGFTTVSIRSEIEGLGLHLAQCLEETGTPQAWLHKAVSIIIGGAGTQDHPSQVILDALCIVLREEGVRSLGEHAIIERRLAELGDEGMRERIAEILDNLSIAFVGDLLHSRVVHSWAYSGRLFNIKFTFIAPPAFELEPWCYVGLHPAISSDLNDARGCKYIYTIRTQLERLKNMMPAHEAKAMVEAIKIMPAFMENYDGEVLDAQPIDGTSPMIASCLWNHLRVIMYMQSACGPPSRMALHRLCDAGRKEEFPLLEVPEFVLQPGDIVLQKTLAEQLDYLASKHEGKQLSIAPVPDGAVIDHLDSGTGALVDIINKRCGFYAGDCGPLYSGEKMPSVSMGTKDAKFLHRVRVKLPVAQMYGLFSKRATLNLMSPEEEREGRPGYIKAELPLPKAVRGFFKCMNEACVTNCFEDSEVRTFFHVLGEKGKAGLECAYCGQNYSAAKLIETL